MTRWLGVVLLGGLMTAGCSESPEGPGGIAANITPLCTIGCGETDPWPDAPGVFLGSGVTPSECLGGGHTDADGDGLSDFCEEHLAYAFRPFLLHSMYDNLGRQPYWAARPLGGFDDPVRIAYLLSYYRDEGSDAYVCSLPGAHWSCHGHNGDSESIIIDVYYWGSKQHWATDSLRYSQHGVWHPALRGSRDRYVSKFVWYDGLTPTVGSVEYGAHAGAAPIAYVSKGKHANYFDRASCNDGGTFSIDTCEDNDQLSRLHAGSYQNIGAPWSPFLDCVVVTDSVHHPYYGSGFEECYWSNTAWFRGWYPLTVGGEDSDPYIETLTHWGFGELPW